MVRRRPVAQVRVPHQAELLQQLQRPVDRGLVDRPGPLAHVRQHLVRGRVTELLDGVEHQLALRGEPVALRAQGRLPVRLALRLLVPRHAPESRRGPAGANGDVAR